MARTRDPRGVTRGAEVARELLPWALAVALLLAWAVVGFIAR